MPGGNSRRFVCRLIPDSGVCAGQTPGSDKDKYSCIAAVQAASSTDWADTVIVGDVRSESSDGEGVTWIGAIGRYGP